MISFVLKLFFDWSLPLGTVQIQFPYKEEMDNEEWVHVVDDQEELKKIHREGLCSVTPKGRFDLLH